MIPWAAATTGMGRAVEKMKERPLDWIHCFHFRLHHHTSHHRNTIIRYHRAIWADLLMFLMTSFQAAGWVSFPFPQQNKYQTHLLSVFFKQLLETNQLNGSLCDTCKQWSPHDNQLPCLKYQHECQFHSAPQKPLPHLHHSLHRPTSHEPASD